MTASFEPALARVVRPPWAARVVSPAYDGVDASYRRRLMDADPMVFLHVTRSLEDAEPGLSETELLEENAAALDRLLDAGAYGAVDGPGLWLYQLDGRGHRQIGVVGDLPMRAFDDGRLLPHERVRPQRATVLADHLGRLRYQSSPVATCYRADSDIDQLVNEIAATEPLLDFARDDGLHQSIWRVDASVVAELAARLGAEAQYIVDGHHRVAAGLEYRQASGDPDVAVLGVAFPHDQLRVAPFHRRVSDLNGWNVDRLLVQLAGEFDIDELGSGDDPHPDDHGVLGLYTEGRWFRLVDRDADPQTFDTVTLQAEILGPLLDIDEAGRDARLEYLPGDAGLARMVEACDESGGAAFALHPITLDQMMDVVDRGETLPPKSTYFDPKVRAGVFLRPY